MVAEYLRRYYARWAETISEPTAHRRDEDSVVLCHVTVGMLGGSTPDVMAADVYTGKDGRVVRMGPCDR